MPYQQYQNTITRKLNHLLSYQTFRSAGLPAFCSLAIILSACNSGQSQASKGDSAATAKAKVQPPKDSILPAATVDLTPIDTALYNKKMTFLANGDSSGRWPVKTAYPIPGAILPFKRIVAYYGNLYSKNMGVL